MLVAAEPALPKQLENPHPGAYVPPAARHLILFGLVSPVHLAVASVSVLNGLLRVPPVSVVARAGASPSNAPRREETLGSTPSSVVPYPTTAAVLKVASTTIQAVRAATADALGSPMTRLPVLDVVSE